MMMVGRRGSSGGGGGGAMNLRGSSGDSAMTFMAGSLAGANLYFGTVDNSTNDNSTTDNSTVNNSTNNTENSAILQELKDIMMDTNKDVNAVKTDLKEVNNKLDGFTPSAKKQPASQTTPRNLSEVRGDIFSQSTPARKPPLRIDEKIEEEEEDEYTNHLIAPVGSPAAHGGGEGHHTATSDAAGTNCMNAPSTKPTVANTTVPDNKFVKLPTLTPRSTPSGLSLTPCKPPELSEFSMEDALRIERMVNSEEFKEQARRNTFGFDDPSISRPPKSTLSSAPPAAAPPVTSATSDAAPAPSTTTPGWGNCFKDVKHMPGWKCKPCMTPNPVDKSMCMACKEPKDPGNDISSLAATTSSPSATAGAGTIGPGGFSLGGALSSAGMASSSSLGGAVGLNAFIPNTAPTGEATGDIFMLKPSANECPRAHSEGETFGDALVNDMNASIGDGGFSCGGTALPPSGEGGATRSGGSLEDESTNWTSAVGFNFGGGVSTSAISNTKPTSSVRFTFGATQSGNEKKEDPVISSLAHSAGDSSLSAGLSGDKQDATKSSTPAFKSTVPFGLMPMPQPTRLATGSIGNKDENSAEPEERAPARIPLLRIDKNEEEDPLYSPRG